MKSCFKGYKVMYFFLIALLITSCFVYASAEENVVTATKWWPFKVSTWYGEYSIEGKQEGIPAPSLEGPKEEMYVPLMPEDLSKKWVIGVSIPHLKDPSWLASNFGVVDSAKHLGVELRVLAAMGYDDISGQISQVENLVNSGIDGLVLAGISYSAQDSLLEEVVKKGIPVVVMINDIYAPYVMGKSIQGYYYMGYACGEHLVEDAVNRDKVNVVLLPGPAGAGWVESAVVGFKAAVEKLAPTKVKILDVKYADSGKVEQMQLLENALQAYAEIDYVVGNGVAIDAATEILKERGLQDKIKLYSTFLTEPLYNKIANGEVAGAPCEGQPYEGRIAVDMVVRILEGQKPGKDIPFMVSPTLPFLTPENVGQYEFEFLLGPRGWRPVFNYSPE